VTARPESDSFATGRSAAADPGLLVSVMVAHAEAVLGSEMEVGAR
jgi:hypothetical protein